MTDTPRTDELFFQKCGGLAPQTAALRMVDFARTLERENESLRAQLAATTRPVEGNFIFKLNAMEAAAQEDNPAEHGYKDKRDAVLQHAERLARERDEAVAARDKERKSVSGMITLLAESRRKTEAAERALAERNEDAERLHGLVEQLANRFKGYLPWPNELRDAVVRGHEMFIEDTIKKADSARKAGTP